jgi:hypothetical protein
MKIRPWYYWLTMLVVLLLIASCVRWQRHITGESQDNSLVECPHEWTENFVYKGDKVDLGDAVGLTTSGRITDIPEFHDCQRLLMPATQTLGPLVGVFVSENVDSVAHALDSLVRLRLFVEGETTTSYTMAVVYNRDQTGYPELGIVHGFHCLRVFVKSGQYQAGIQEVQGTESACATPLSPLSPALKALTVKTSPGLTAFPDGDFPAVARWDMDSTTNTQYIGLKCAKAVWCEIGPKAVYTQSNPDDPGATTTPEARVRRIKGWYDEQYLSVPSAPGSSDLVASMTKATVIPDPGLETYEESAYKGKWQTVGFVALDRAVPEYKTKLNMDVVTPGAPLTSMTKLAMCEGRSWQCGTAFYAFPSGTCGSMNWFWSLFFPRWYQSSTSMADNTVEKRCVIRRTHDKVMGIPGTTRWRWTAKDETIWAECALGCCEVEAGGID